MGKQYTYVCSAACIPSCEFTWKYMGKTFKGDQVQIPILRQRDNTTFSSQREVTFSDYSKLKPLTCEATNTVSHATITATKNLTVIGECAVLLPTLEQKMVSGQVQNMSFMFMLGVLNVLFAKTPSQCVPPLEPCQCQESLSLCSVLALRTRRPLHGSRTNTQYLRLKECISPLATSQ